MRSRLLRVCITMISLAFARDLGFTGMLMEPFALHLTVRGRHITVEEASPHSADRVQALFAVAHSGTAC